MTISAHIIDNQKIKQIDDFLSNVASLKKELKEQQAASFWVHVDDLADVFRLQDIFGLNPLAIDAVIHQNHPSKVEEYDTYLFTIIDGIRIEEKGGFTEDDLYIFLGKRWIITINFYNVQFSDNLRKKIGSILSAPEKQVLSAQGICETLYHLAVEEIISAYLPTIYNIDARLNKIEEAVLDNSSKAHLSEMLVIRRKISFVGNTIEMILRV